MNQSTLHAHNYLIRCLFPPCRRLDLISASPSLALRDQVQEANIRVEEAEAEVLMARRGQMTAQQHHVDHVESAHEEAHAEIKAEEEHVLAKAEVEPHEEAWQEIEDEALEKERDHEEAYQAVVDKAKVASKHQSLGTTGQIQPA